ncbi:coiled-coil domain-containing protein 18-like [Dendronephthya gigantea]|uniref:coiled-coil domain-containing protein 18-like n=1 Tax=Dendronephthya gigantea TaxID=151771 RepID=UPI00106C4C69|nr:coiled-coil domain-containing protein 18-like [Dendronephthya gigantea]
MSDTDSEYESSDNELIEPLLRENKRLRWTLAKYQKKNSLLKDVLSDKDIKISELQKRDEERDELVSRQEDTIRNLIRQMNEQTAELNFLSAKLKDASNESGGDVKPAHDVISPRDTELQSLKATIDIQSRRNNELSDELQQERKKREKLETDIDMWRFNLGECERELEQLKEQKEKLKQDYQRMKRDADVSKRLLSDVKLQLKNVKSEQELARIKAEEQKKEAVDVKSQFDKERKNANKFKEDHDKMKEKFDEYRRGYDEIKVKHDQVKRELGETKEELRVKTHQYSRQNRHFKDLERKYRELTEMHNRLKDRMDEKENELIEKDKVLKEFQEKVWLKDKVMNDFKVNAEEAIERAAELDRSLEEKTEDAQSQGERIDGLKRLVAEMKAELAKANTDELRRELEARDAKIRELGGELNLAKNKLERREEELQYLKKASEDLQFIANSLEEKEYEVTKLEALNSDLRTQIAFKDDQLASLQKAVEEHKILLESQMYDLESYVRQVGEKNKLVQDLKDEIDSHCKTIDQKDKEIKRHKREKDDVRKEVEWKEKKVQGVEEDISLQRKQLDLMENEMKRRENEVEERESEILMELTAMKEKMVEKDAKIESLNSDLMEVKEYIEEEAKLVAEKDKEMEDLKDELKREKHVNKTNDPKSIREMARKHHQADLMKEKRRHEQESKKLKQRILELEENLKDERSQKEGERKENEARINKLVEEKEMLDGAVKELSGKLESQKKARLNDKKLSEDIEQKFWSEEERYVEEIRAIELSREKMKHENESLKEDLEVLEGVRENLEEKTRQVEDLKVELDEVLQAKKEEKDMMRKLISEGEEVIAMYKNEVQQLKGKLINEPAIDSQHGVNGSVEEMRRLIELEYNIGREEKNVENDHEIEAEYLKLMQGTSTQPKEAIFGRSTNKKQTKQDNIWTYSWLSLVLILVSVPVLFAQFPTHVVMTCVLLYLSTLGYLVWKETAGCRKLLKPGEANETLSKAVSDIYEENQSLRKTVEQLIVRVASETVEKNELAKRTGGNGEGSETGAVDGQGRDSVTAKDMGRELAEKSKTIDTLKEMRRKLTEEGKQLKARLRANEGVLQQKDKVIKKLEQKLRDLMDGEGVDLSTEKIVQEIRQDDEQKDAKKREALERFQQLTASVMKNAKDERTLGAMFAVLVVVGVVFLAVCKSSLLFSSSFLALLCVVILLVSWFIMKSRDEVAKLAEELNVEAERSLESSKEIQELSTLVEKHLEVVTKQKRAISALERQLKVEYGRNENQKLIIAKLTWTIQEGKDIENLLGRSGSYRGQDKKALEQALKTMAENHVKEKIDLFKTMRAHLAEDDVDNEEKRWILQDLKQATRDITKSLPSVPQKVGECTIKELKQFWKIGAVFLSCFLAFLWLFYAEYFGMSLMPLIGCATFVVLKKTGTESNRRCDTSIRCLIMDILFVCIAISTVSLVHSNGLLKEMAFITVLATAGVRVLFKKLVTSDESALSLQKSQEIEDLQERVGEEVRRQQRMTEQMETWKRLLEVERSYNKESDDVITEVRELEQRAQREVRREIERLRKEKRERLEHVDELERELKKSTTHCSKQRRQMEELNRVIKELEKRQKQGSREIDVLKELNKYEKEELSVALEEEKKSREEIMRNVEKEKQQVKHETTSKMNQERKELTEKVKELEQKLGDERKVAKDFLEQVDSELAKNEKMNSEITEMKSQIEHERGTREDLRKRFQEINKIRQDREKVLLDQIDDLQNQLAKQKATLETVTRELEDNVDSSKKEKSQSLYNIQEKQISELQHRLSMATKTIEELRQQEKSTMNDLQDMRDRQGKLLKDLSAVQEKSNQDHRTMQRKQKEIKELKTSVDKLSRENERLKTKLDSALLESSLGARVVKSEVVHEDKDGRRQGVDRRGEDEKKDEQPSKKDEETVPVNGGLDTSRSENIAIAELAEVSENEDYIEGKDTTKRGVPADFDHKDTQGILYWLGTGGGTEEWKNPAESGLMKITRSSYGHGKASDVAERKGSWCSTSNKTNQWWKIDFGEKRSVLPSAYTLQHGWSGVSGALRNWVLEGSRDGKVWHILANHVNDDTLDKGYAAATWKIDDVSTAYRFLRVRQTGKNEAGKDSLRLSGLEVYGQLVLND